MQPNKSWTPWGFIPGLITLIGVGAVVLIGIGLLAQIPTSGISWGDSIDDQLCVTTKVDETVFMDKSSLGKASRDGVRSTPAETLHCKPYDRFTHPSAARALQQIGPMPIAVAILVLALSFRRIIKQSWENGPFHPDTTLRLDRFRWLAAGAVGTALLVDWAALGIKLQLLTDEGWPGLSFLRATALVWVAAALVSWLCAFGARQRQDAWQQGLAHGGDGDGPV